MVGYLLQNAMKILNNYLTKSLLYPLIYCLIGFLLIFIIDDLFNNFSDFLDSGIQPAEILYYYAMILPPIVVLIMPACLLLSVLYCLSQLTRHSEITAMRASGISIYRIVFPIIGVGFIATLVSAFINERIAPTSAYKAEQFLEFQKQGRVEDIYFSDNIALKNDGHVWMIRKFDTRDQSMQNVELVLQREDGSDATKVQAEKALWLDGRWWFTDVVVQDYSETGDLRGAPEILLQKEMREISETPETFMSEIKDPQYLSSLEMKNYLVSKTGLSPNTRSRLMVDMHTRIATPLVCLIVTIIGVPIGAHTGRQGALAGVMLAMSLFFGFYILQLVFQGLGKQELIEPWIAGWAPVILFGAASPFMIYRMR